MSFDEALLERLDASAEVQCRGRSAVMRQAVAEYLARRARREIARGYERRLRRRGGSGRGVLRLGGAGTVARELNRGEIWLYQARPPDKRRPVVVLSRQEVIRLLDTVMVAPVTSTVCGAPSEVLLGVDEGLQRESAANLDPVQTVDKARLKRFLGTASPAKMTAICRALAIATGCGG